MTSLQPQNPQHQPLLRRATQPACTPPRRHRPQHPQHNFAAHPALPQRDQVTPSRNQRPPDREKTTRQIVIHLSPVRCSEGVIGKVRHIAGQVVIVLLVLVAVIGPHQVQNLDLYNPNLINPTLRIARPSEFALLPHRVR
jgi:hypothetical protein